MDRFFPAYTAEQLLDVERSYYYEDASNPCLEATPGSIGRTLSTALLATLLAASSTTPLPKQSAVTFGIVEVEALAKQTLEATTESADFRDVVRQFGKASVKQLPPPSLAMGPDFHLGEVDYLDELAIAPATAVTKRVRVRVKNTYLAEPSIKDLSLSSLSLTDAAI